jgi:hypothetical protein
MNILMIFNMDPCTFWGVFLTISIIAIGMFWDSPNERDY